MVNHIGNFEMSSANICTNKLWVYQHFDIVSSQKLGYIVKPMSFKTFQYKIQVRLPKM